MAIPRERMVRINATLNRALLDKIRMYAEANLEDNSTAIRQLISRGLLAAQEDRGMRAYQEGRVTLREASEMLGIHPLEMQDLLAARGIPIQDLREEEIRERIKSISRF